MTRNDAHTSHTQKTGRVAQNDNWPNRNNTKSIARNQRLDHAMYLSAVVALTYICKSILSNHPTCSLCGPVQLSNIFHTPQHKKRPIYPYVPTIPI